MINCLHPIWNNSSLMNTADKSSIEEEAGSQYLLRDEVPCASLFHCKSHAIKYLVVAGEVCPSYIKDGALISMLEVNKPTIDWRNTLYLPENKNTIWNPTLPHIPRNMLDTLVQMLQESSPHLPHPPTNWIIRRSMTCHFGKIAKWVRPIQRSVWHTKLEACYGLFQRGACS